MARKKISGIYKITSPSGKIYIGQSWDIMVRWYRHRSAKEPGSIIKKSILKYGHKAHVFEIVHELPSDATQSVLNEYERLYIELYKDCGIIMLNIREGGSNGKLAPESIQKMRIKLIGKPAWNKGIKSDVIPWNKGLRGVVKFSEATKKQMSESLKGHKNNLGKKMSEKTRLAINKANTGRKVSDAHKELLRKHMLAKPNRGGTKNKGVVRSDENKEKIRQTLKNRTDNKGSGSSVAIFTEAQVLEIRRKFKRKVYTSTMLGKEYQASKSTILAIVNRKTWRHI